MANDVVIEIRGGTLVAVYADDPAIGVVLIDWDDEEFGGEVGRPYPLDPLSAMPSDTREQYTSALAAEQQLLAP